MIIDKSAYKITDVLTATIIVKDIELVHHVLKRLKDKSKSKYWQTKIYKVHNYLF